MLVNINMKLAISVLCCLFLFSGFSYAEESKFRWKELRAACKGDHEAPECIEKREQARAFCAANPEKKRCRKLHAMKECRKNPDSEKCQEFKARFKAYCEEHPGSKKCVGARVHKICKEDPKSEECLTAKENAHAQFCDKHPDHKKCT